MIPPVLHLTPDPAINSIPELDNAPILGIPECEIPKDADELEAPNELHHQIHVDPQPDDIPDLLLAGHLEGLYIPPAVIDLPNDSSIQEETQQEENSNIPPPVLCSSNRFRATRLNRVYYDLHKGEHSVEPNILGNASNDKSNSAIFKGPSTVSQAIESSDSDAWTNATGIRFPHQERHLGTRPSSS